VVLEKLEPRIVWSIFEDIFTKSPRPSNREEKVRQKIKDWVLEHKKQGLEVVQDSAGNLLVRKQATKGKGTWPALLFQGHMDMVCETSRPGGFDFQNSAIPVRIDPDGEWVSADSTTLGADDGIGVSLALALLIDDDPAFVHGPIEVLITFAEETGLDGAENLDQGILGIKSKHMINVDSEEFATVTIGSAGGGAMHVNTAFTYEQESRKSGLSYHELFVSGLRGGHSGVDIHLPRANAIKLTARVLSSVVEKIPIFLHAWDGGTRTNAIPRDAKVQFAVNAKDARILADAVRMETANLEQYYKGRAASGEIMEPELKITLNTVESVACMSSQKSEEIVRLATALPHGPDKFSPVLPSLVETSNNVAVIKTDPATRKFDILLYPRSNVDAELEAFRRRLASIGRLAGWTIELDDAYPAWPPDPSSSLLKFVKQKYEATINKPVNIMAVHAGLECSVIGKKIPALSKNIVSLGPLVENAHSPAERIRIKDVHILYQALKSMLSSASELILK